MTEDKITVFTNESFGKLRTLEINGEPWFVGKDVADILGYTNTPKAIRNHVDDEDKLTERIVLSGQNREAIFINESGLYSLIFSSKLPTAKKFKRWVTSEVLPSIRRSGGYVQSGRETEFLANPDSPIYSHIRNLENSIALLQKQVMSLSCSIDTKSINIWKKQISTPLVEKIIDISSNKDMQSTYKMIYHIMTKEFGFSEAVAITQFGNKYHCTDTSVINAIADNPIYQQEFVQAAKKLFDIQCSVVCDKSNASASKRLETKFNINDDFENVINTLANVIHDNSGNHTHTYRQVYQRMNTQKGWRNLMTRNRTKLKKNVVLANKKQYKKFIAVSNEIYNERVGEN